MTERASGRLPSLDALRGIAALIVVLHHCYLMLPAQAHQHVPLWVAFSPLRLLYSGHASVVLFYTLSGYVLAIPFLRETRMLYSVYLIRRFCRIYIPFACVIFFAALLYYCCPPLADGQGSAWLRGLWKGEPLILPVVLRHLAMTGSGKDMWLNGVMWSLVYELRISILFPFLIPLAGRPGKAILLALAAYAAAVFLAIGTGNDHAINEADSFAASFILTLRFITFFIIGMTAVRHNDVIKLWLSRMPQILWLLAFFAAAAAFSLPPEIYNERLRNFFPFFNSNNAMKYIMELAIGMASTFLIVSARNREVFARILMLPPLQWLGKVSYSLYLIHLPIAIFAFHALLGKAGWFLISALTVAISLALAEIFYRAVERPSVQLGRKLAEKALWKESSTESATP